MLPIFMRSRSMNPLGFACTRSCPRSTARWIVSTWVSMTMAARCSAIVLSVACFTSVGTTALPLVGGDAGLGGDRGELADFRGNELPEAVRRGRAPRDVVLFEPQLQLGIGQHCVRLRIEARHDGLRRMGGRHDPEPLADVEARKAELGERRDVRQA